MIFRDDDICHTTKLDRFIEMDELFKKYNVDHTIAIITKDLEKNPDLIQYIKDNPHIKVQSHGWEHIRYSDMQLFKEHLELSKKKLTEIFGQTPTVWYPAWNETNKEMDKVANEVGLSPYPNHISISGYVRLNGKTDKDTINMHYWAEEMKFLESALKIAQVKIRYTAILGDYDKLIERPVEKGWRQICFTDQDIKSDTWEIVKIKNTQDNKLCRKIKLLPHKFLPDHSVSVWMDGNITPEVDLDTLIEGKNFCAMKHDHRNNIYDEANACFELKKGLETIITKQIEEYGKDIKGLVATGVLIRKNTEENRKFGEKWWKEVEKHSRRDQLSFPYVAKKLKFDYEVIDWLGGVKKVNHKV